MSAPTVTIKNLPDSTVEIALAVPAEAFEKYVDKATRRLARAYKFKGFRPGMAPRHVVEQALGADRVRDEAAELAVREHYPAIVREYQLRPIGNPQVKVTAAAAGQAFECALTVPVISELTLPDYKAIMVTKAAATVSAAEIDEALAHLCNARASHTSVNRPSAKGDVVEIDFITRSGGVKIENGESKNHPLLLGEGRFIPGFEEAIEGMAAGQEKQFGLVAPPDYYHKAVAGKKLDFTVTMRRVLERTAPALDDGFAQTVGMFKTLAELRASVEKGLAAEKALEAEQIARNTLIEKITAGASVRFPSLLTEQELTDMLETLKNDVARSGLTWQTYLANTNKTEAALRVDLRPRAEARVKAALVIDAIIDKEQIEAAAEEIKERTLAYLRRFQTAKEAAKHIDPATLEERIRRQICEEKLFVRLASQLVPATP